MASRPANDRLRALLAEARWTQDALAHAVNAVGAEVGQPTRYDRSAVAHWLSGTRPLARARGLIVEAMSRRLGRRVTAETLGFRSPGISGAPFADLGQLAGMDLHPAEHAELRSLIYRLDVLSVPEWSPDLRPSGATSTDRPARQPTVVAARQVLWWSAALDHSHGSGHARTPLIAYLAHDLGPELPTARASLIKVAVDLACLAAFRCFDELAHGLAQRYYLAALDLAIRVRDPIRYATVLRGLSHQAHQLGHHEHALVLITRALAATGDRTPPHTRAFLHIQAALCHSALGNAHTALRHRDRARHERARTGEPIGCCHPGELAYHGARVLHLLGDTRRAIAALHAAVRQIPATHRRSRVLTLALLTQLLLDTGHLSRARTMWNRLQAEMEGLRSVRATTTLTPLRARLHHAALLPVFTGIGSSRTGSRFPSSSAVSLGQRCAEGLASYRAVLAATNLSDHTRRNYTGRVATFLRWLRDNPQDGGDPLDTRHGRDQAVRAYLTWLRADCGRAPSTSNAHLTAIGHFYRSQGRTAPAVRRTPSSRSQPGGPTRAEKNRFARAAQQCGVRDQAIGLLWLHTGLSAERIATLDVTDIVLGFRTGAATVRGATRGTYVIPLSRQVSGALRQWLAARPGYPGADGTPALFLSRSGNRLQARSIRAVIHTLRERCRATASPHP